MVDLRHVREVPTEKAETFCKENGISFIETSARDNSNVEEAFESLLTMIFESKPVLDDDGYDDNNGKSNV